MFYTLLQTLNSSGFQEEYKSIKSDILNGKFYDNLEPYFKFEKKCAFLRFFRFTVEPI